MKKKMQAAIAISLVIFCLLGCGDSSAKESCSKVDCKIMLEKDWSTFCVYSSETEMLLALECKNDDTEDAYRSIGAETRAFILYDLEEEEIKRIYPMDMDALSYSAAPFQDGLIYVNSTEGKENLEWQVVYLSEHSSDVMLEGTCIYPDQLPSISMVNGVPLVLWMNFEDETAGLSSVTEHGMNCIISENLNWLINTSAACNSKEICFPAGGDSKYAELVVADASGMISQVRLDGKITSYALTKDHVVCGLGDWEETGLFRLLRYQFRTGEKSEEAVPEPFYRMCGGDQNEALCVDSSFSIYSIDAADNQFERRNDLFPTSPCPVVFRPMQGGKRIAGFLKDAQYTYYIMDAA